jgi:hypothetical protein
MKLLLDENGHAVLEDGKPVYEHQDGRKIPFDGAQAFGKIGTLTGENTTYRKRFEEAESKLKAFDGIEDAAAARKAMDVVASLDQKKLIDVGEIEKVKGEISKAFQTQLDEANGKAQTYEQQLYAEKIGGSFARSKYIADKLAVPVDMVQATFGQNLKVEEGKVVAYDAQGQKIFSRSRPGELADFDEAIETLVSQYPHRDHILKSSDANGGGAPNGGGGNSGAKGNFGGSKADRVAAIKAMTATS